jgi:predicted RNase H-like HicB family nuclease
LCGGKTQKITAVPSPQSLCPELDIASQGDSIESARKNLKEALELFFETASPKEIQQRLPNTTVTVPVPNHSELTIGTLQSIIRQSGIPRDNFE